MNPFKILLAEIVYRPIFNLLIVLLWITQGNMGLAIIGLTLAVRFLLLNTSKASNDMQKQMSDIQPKLQEIQIKYVDNPKKLSEETMKLFKNTGGGPFKGCLMMLLQIPVFVGLFFVVRDFANNQIVNTSLYSFFSYFGTYYLRPENINHWFLNMDLLQSGVKFEILLNQNLYLAVIGSILMYLQMKISMINKPVTTPSKVPGMPQMPDMNNFMGMMNMFLVLSMGTFIYSMPAGIGIYVITSSLFSIIQTGLQFKELIKIKINTYFSK